MCCSNGSRWLAVLTACWIHMSKALRSRIRVFSSSRSREAAPAAKPRSMSAICIRSTSSARAPQACAAVLLDEAGLYPDVDCPRVRSLAELVDQISRGVFD